MQSKKLIEKKNTAAVPLGLRSIIEQCERLYPDQPNPLQVTTVLKYWLGGQDPLDYISMYYNKGDVERDIPQHWHYVSFGLSDLHGDGRVHILDPDNTENRKSGMGFELTFRLLIKDKEKDSKKQPPTWPANLLQNIARYCFQSGNRLCAGDNIPWRKSLDGSDSNIHNLLIAEDPQLLRTKSPFGWVEFCQIVGVTEEELKEASRWNGKGVLNLLQREPATGGEWLITDMERSRSVFELFPETLRQLADDLEKEGSDLAGINAEFNFREMYKRTCKTEIDSDTLNQACSSEDKKDTPPVGDSLELGFLDSMSINNSLQSSCPIDTQPDPTNIVALDGIELTFELHAATFLMLAIKDRIRHGRHFTFKGQNLALTFVAESVTGTVVSKDCPYGVFGYWLQVLIPEDLIPQMMEAFQNIPITETTLDKDLEYEWPEKNLKIIITNVLRPFNLDL